MFFRAVRSIFAHSLSDPPELIQNSGRLANQIKRQGNQGVCHGFDAVRLPELVPDCGRQRESSQFRRFGHVPDKPQNIDCRTPNVEIRSSFGCASLEILRFSILLFCGFPRRSTGKKINFTSAEEDTFQNGVDSRTVCTDGLLKSKRNSTLECFSWTNCSRE